MNRGVSPEGTTLAKVKEELRSFTFHPSPEVPFVFFGPWGSLRVTLKPRALLFISETQREVPTYLKALKLPQTVGVAAFLTPSWSPGVTLPSWGRGWRGCRGGRQRPDTFFLQYGTGGPLTVQSFPANSCPGVRWGVSEI